MTSPIIVPFSNDQVAAEIVAHLTNASAPNDYIEATLTRDLMDSWEGPSIYYNFRLKIAGEWVPPEDIDGPLQINPAAIGNHTGGFSFGLKGRNWSIAATEKVWARLPVEVYLDHGRLGAVIEPTTPDYRGYVLANSRQKPGHLPVVTVDCGDEASLWDNAELCEEIPPLSGNSRGQIVALTANSVGLNASVADGEIYRSSIQTARKRLFDFLLPFVEPQGWDLRVRDDVLVNEKYEIKLEPLSPDFVWSKSDCISVQPLPPSESPSRWVLHAVSTREIDETGLETTTTTVILKDTYAQGYCPEQQQVGGTPGSPSIVSTGFTAPSASYRTVSIVEIKESRRGGLLVLVQQEERGWHWIHTGKFQSNGSTAGTAGGGFNYIACYINEDGNHVTHSHEKFGVIGRRRTEYTYDAVGTKIFERIQEFKISAGPSRGVRNVGDSDDETSVSGVHVYDDDQSYELSREELRLVSDITEEIVYDTAGRGVGTEQRLKTRYPIRCHVDGPSPVTSYWVNHQGHGQTEEIPTEKTAQIRTTRKQIRSDGLSTGEAVTYQEYVHREKADGDWNWGGFSSNYSKEEFGFSRSEFNSYTVEVPGLVQVEKYTAEGREAHTILGNPPITDYTGSVWKRSTAEPLQMVFDDPVAEAWFGAMRETINHEHVQSLEEAEAVILARRRRLMSPKVEVVRPYNGLVTEGKTVYLSSPEDGIADRYIITNAPSICQIGEVWVSTYTLEAWGAVN